MKKVTPIILIFNLLIITSLNAQEDSVLVLTRCDDFGMSNSVNRAIEKFISLNIPISTSVMFVCPWYQQAVEILKENPQVSVGIHLTLNSEWKNYKWGPILGIDASSLTDSNGYFFPSRKLLYENDPKIEEVEKELRAQIERAMKSGIKIDYIDYHMGTAVDKLEYREIVERLAKEYQLGISRYFDELYSDNMYSINPELKKDTLIDIINNRLKKDRINLLVCHIGIDNDELRALIDLNSFGLKEMSRHRQAELDALLSPDFLEALKNNKVRLITYRDLVKEIGLVNMKRPN